MRKLTLTMAALALLAAWSGTADAKAKRFADAVGNVPVGPVKPGPHDLPFIVWGGESATFEANGQSLATKPGSIFAKQGLEFKLVPGDDPTAQAKAYLAGKTPWFRGTFRMLALANSVFTNDPRTQPVLVVQMTWSRGDHAVARGKLKTVKDICGKTVAIQEFGPHVGMLEDILKTAGCGWNDIRVVWMPNITGKGSPAEKFKQDQTVDVAFAVTPDMIGITGGYGKTGSGAEGTVHGAHVLVSTQELSRSIADIYVVRRDYYDSHRDEVERFAAAYLKGAETVAAEREKRTARYRSLLGFMVKTWGTDVLPNANEADGLIADCAFVGHAGNEEFFTRSGNPVGFEAFVRSGNGLAQTLGQTAKPGPIRAPDWNWRGGAFAKIGLSTMGAARTTRFKAEATAAELEQLTMGGMEDNTIYAFTIGFAANQTEFRAADYRGDFDKALELSAKYGGAVIAIRGHTDVVELLNAVVKCGLQQKLLERRGTPGNFKYFLDGKPLDRQENAPLLVRAIDAGTFDRCSPSPRDVVQAARLLSLDRSRAVRDELGAYAARKKVVIDPSQFQPQGVGVREPMIPIPRSESDMAQNRRVEFAIVRVSAEASSASAIEY